MNCSVDVLLVTGYLGSGKSTLLQHLLRQPEIVQRNPALIINEFGQEGVDGRYFDQSGWPLFEINRGSLFCICTQTELLDALTQITRLKPGIILVEATGVAETRDIESLLEEPSLQGQFRVRGNICVVDALNFTKIAPFLKTARNQVAMADGLVVNKIDLVPSQQLAPLCQLLGNMNSRASRSEVTQGRIAYSFLENLSHQRATESLATAQPDAVYARSFHAQTPVDRAAFMHAIEQLGTQLLRLKGHVLFADQPEPQFVETIYDRINIQPRISDVQATSLTVIAFGLPAEQLEQAFADILRHRSR